MFISSKINQNTYIKTFIYILFRDIKTFKNIN